MTPVPIAARLRHVARRAGWSTLAGLVLFAACAAIELGPLPAAQSKLAGLRAQIAKARTQRHAPQRGATDAAGLMAALPGRDTLEAGIAAIHEAAAAQGLITSGGEYRSRTEAGGELLRYEIGMPLRGAYEPLRAWLADLGARQPALAIEEIGLHRVNAEQAQLEARLRLVLFRRNRPGSPAADGAAPALPALQFVAATGELFAQRSWQPPPPPAPQLEPRAPPLPFKYTGKLIEDKSVRVFLTQGETTTLVAAGDRLGNYDIESVTNSSVALRFRPLQEKQTLNFGGYD